jgi:hypothetical protein
MPDLAIDKVDQARSRLAGFQQVLLWLYISSLQVEQHISERVVGRCVCGDGLVDRHSRWEAVAVAEQHAAVHELHERKPIGGVEVAEHAEGIHGCGALAGRGPRAAVGGAMRARPATPRRCRRVARRCRTGICCGVGKLWEAAAGLKRGS